jgi:hypothetical protein
MDFALVPMLSNSGYTNFVQKPFHFPALDAKVCALLARAQAPPRSLGKEPSNTLATSSSSAGVRSYTGGSMLPERL